MTVAIQIPTPLRSFTGDRAEVQVDDASTVAEAMRRLVSLHPRLEPHLYGDDGALRSFVNVFVNGEDSRHLEGPETSLSAGDEVMIVPAIAGGSPPVGLARVVEGGTGVELTPPEIRRYSRHLIMPEVGMEGQKRLKAAKVLLIGGGGLGSPLGLYLAAAGVGTLGLVDFDVVDESNLQRQVLYGQSDVGRPKIEAARERLAEINPHVELVSHPLRLDSSNALEVLEPYDVVIDGTDNFPTRYLVNDACVLLGKPNVYGSIFRFEGQVSVFWKGHGPCYRCLFPEPPPPGLVPSCAEGGVLGVLPGIVGALQANEAIKLIIGRGEPLLGRFVLFDALKMRFRELALKPSPECPVCSEHPTQTGLIDYQAFCGIPSGHEDVAYHEEPELDDWEISVGQLARWRQDGGELTLVDVRQPEEWEICRIDGATLIPLRQLPDRIEEIDRDRPLVAYCHKGSRSAQAVDYLLQRGFTQAKNLVGGIDAWSREVDPSVPRY